MPFLFILLLLLLLLSVNHVVFVAGWGRKAKKKGRRLPVGSVWIAVEKSTEKGTYIYSVYTTQYSRYLSGFLW